MNKITLIVILPLVCSASIATAQQDCGLADLDPIALDKNHNAEISRDEAQGTTLAWAFDKVDTNGDGTINQPEFSARCSSYQSDNSNSAQAATKAEPREATAAEKAAVEKAERQKSRQAQKVDSRVDKETDEAVDSAIDKGLDRLFGR